MAKKTKYSTELYELVNDLLEQGMTHREVGEQLRLKTSVVQMMHYKDRDAELTHSVDVVRNYHLTKDKIAFSALTDKQMERIEELSKVLKGGV